MKLRLPHKFQAALMAALASVSITTLSSGTLAVATGAALLAGQQAQAVSLDDAVLQTENITSTITVEDWTATEMSVAIELDMAAFKDFLTTTWIAGKANKNAFLEVEGTWNTATGGRTDTEGLHMDGSSTTKYGTPYGQGTSPGGSGNIKLNNLSESLKFTASTNWDNYEAMSVVLTFNGGSEMTATWYIKNADGTTSTYYGTTTGARWGTSTAFTPDGTIKNIDTSMVNYMAVFDSKLNQTDSATIAGAVLTRTPVDYGMEFSGDVFTIEQTTNQTFHNATFSSWYQDESGRWKKGSHTWGGGSTTYYVGEEERTVTGGSFWRSLFGDGQGGYTARLGNTIRLTGATGNVYYESTFTPYQLGGIIVEEGNSGTYVLGRNGATVIHIKAREGEQANMYVASNLGLSTNAANGINIQSSGTWKVFEGKSLTFGFFNNTSNPSSIANNGSITFKTGVTVSMVGGGTVDMTHTNNLTIESGATVEVGENTLAKFANGTTLNGTVNNEGTATFNGLSRGTGSALTNTGTLTLDGTITFGGSAITNNATGTVGFGDNVKFDLDTLTATGSDADGWTFTLFSGTGTGVDLSDFDVTNIIMTTHGGTAGKNWDFSTLNQISYTVNPEKVWDAGVGNWNYTDANWTGQKFEQGDIAVFNDDAIVAVQGAVEAGGITVTGSNAAGVNISAGTDASLTAGTVRVDAGNNLVTGIAIEGLQDFNVAGNWTIDADQALGTGTINGGVLTISKDKTVTLTNAENSATLLRDIAGGGNIKLTQDTFFEGSSTAGAAPTTQARGTLFVDGVTLSIGSMNTGPYNHTYVNMSSFEHVQLDNGTLYIHNDEFDLNGLTVNSGKTGTVRIYDTAGYDYNTLNLKGTTKVDGTLIFTGDWKQSFTIEALAGTGEVKFQGISHDEGAPKRQTANLQGGTIGKLTIDGNNAATAIVNVNGGLTVTNGMTINKGALNISDTLTLSGGVSTISSAINGTGSLVVNSGATLKLGGAGLINVGTLTMNSGSLLDVSNLTQMAGLTVNLASYTNSVSCTAANITGVNSSLIPTLNTTGGNVTLTFASAPVPTPVPTSPDLGNVMYVGDSITDGVTGMKSWRYSFFQVLADGGIAQNEQGYYQHSQSSGAITETTYGGRDFENNHSARASARSWETAGVPTSIKGGDRYDYSSIQNWLGQSETKRNGQAYPADKPRYSGDDAPNTYFMLLGTNDLLSEGGNHVTDAHFSNVLASMFGYDGSTFDGETGTFDIIWKSMTDARSDSKLIVLEMPTWSPNHGNHQDAADFAYMTKFNQKLHEWVDSKANKAQITIVNPNPGIVDVANTTKPGSGVATMYVDNLHPNAQGELLIAGNVARQLGYAGRTVGLDRASYAPGSTTWTAADNTSITVGTEAQVFAEGAFHTLDGYTIDFGAVYGNGIAGGWSDKANGLSVQVGDGIHSGTLTFSEAYVMWGDKILYSRDNSQTGDNFRIAYVNSSVNASDNVTAGYYVWMGDQLIGEGLAGSGDFNGIRLTSTGVNGTVTNLTWSDTAYAPTTTLYENPDSEALFHLVQVNPNPNHDNPVKQGIQDDIDWQTTTDKFALPSGQSSTAKTIYKEFSSNIGAAYTGVANANYEGDIGMHYTGDLNMDARQSVLSVYNATVTGNVYVQLDNPNTVYNSFTNTDQLSVTAGYNGNITGSYTAVYNAGIFNYDVRGGEHNNANATIGGGSYSYVNGGTFKANVMGGGRRGTINGGTHVTVTGGEIAGSVYGGGIGGTINDGTYVTITGGVIGGDVNGGGTGGTITGSTNVTVEGNLPSIGGNVSADNVTLKDVALNEEGYTDGFDCYRGTITATTLTLDNYTVGEMLATVTAANLALTNGTETTINTLTTAAGTAITVDATSSLTLGQANLSAAISNAGTLVLTQDITATGLVEESHTDYRVGADDEKSENGNYFYTGTRTESTIRVVSGEGDLQVADGLTVTQGGHAYTLASDGTATGVTADNVFYGIFVQSEAGTTLNVSDIAATSAKHNQILYQVAVDSANLVVDQFVQYVQIADAHVTNTVDTDFIGALQITGGDNTLVGSVTSLPEMTLFVRGAAGSLKMQNATATPYQVAAGNGITFADTGSVTISAAVAEEGSEQFDVYALNNARFTVEANTMQAMNTGNVTVNNHLKVASIATGGAGSLTLANGVEDTLKNVTALNGDIKFLNMAEARGTTSGEQTQVGLDSLYIGSSKTVSFYENGIVDAAQEASVTVSGTLTAGSGAQLNANLEMASGSHLNVSGAQGTMGLLMGSNVTLNSDSYLDIEGYSQDQVSGYLYNYLASGEHELYYLFSGTENDSLSLKIDGAQVQQLTFTDWTQFDKDASEVYKNLQAQTFYMVYDGSNVGMVAIGLLPEPTTGTLSLLALCALAARRRRK